MTERSHTKPQVKAKYLCAFQQAKVLDHIQFISKRGSSTCGNGHFKQLKTLTNFTPAHYARKKYTRKCKVRYPDLIQCQYINFIYTCPPSHCTCLRFIEASIHLISHCLSHADIYYVITTLYFNSTSSIDRPVSGTEIRSGPIRGHFQWIWI